MARVRNSAIAFRLSDNSITDAGLNSATTRTGLSVGAGGSDGLAFGRGRILAGVIGTAGGGAMDRSRRVSTPTETTLAPRCFNDSRCSIVTSSKRVKSSFKVRRIGPRQARDTE